MRMPKNSNIEDVVGEPAFERLRRKVLAKWKELTVEEARADLPYNLFEIFREKLPEKFDDLPDETHTIYFKRKTAETVVQPKKKKLSSIQPSLF